MSKALHNDGTITEWDERLRMIGAVEIADPADRNPNLPRTSEEFETLLTTHMVRWEHTEMSRFDSLFPAFQALDSDARDELCGFIADIIGKFEKTGSPHYESHLFWISLSSLARNAKLLEAPQSETLRDALAGARAEGFPLNDVSRACALLLLIRAGGAVTPSEILADILLCRAAPRLVINMLEELKVPGEMIGLLLAKFTRERISDPGVAIENILPLSKMMVVDVGVPLDFIPAMFQLISDQIPPGEERENFENAVREILGWDCRDEGIVRIYPPSGASEWLGRRKSLLDEMSTKMCAYPFESYPDLKAFFERLVVVRAAGRPETSIPAQIPPNLDGYFESFLAKQDAVRR